MALHGYEPESSVSLASARDLLVALSSGVEGSLLHRLLTGSGAPTESLQLFEASFRAMRSRRALRLVVDDTIIPDSGALRDDLVHVAEVLAAAESTDCIDYIARFLAGVARSSHDPRLEDAATALARDHSAGLALAADLARISGLVQDRLAAAGA